MLNVDEQQTSDRRVDGHADDCDEQHSAYFRLTYGHTFRDNVYRQMWSH